MSGTVIIVRECSPGGYRTLRLSGMQTTHHYVVTLRAKLRSVL